MDKKLLLSRIAAILTTLAETGGAIESMLYIFCEMNMDHWQTIRGILLEADYVKIKGHYVTLTAEGRAVAAKLDVLVSRASQS